VADEGRQEQAEPREPSEEDLLAALDRIGVSDVLVQALATTASIGFRRVSAEGRDLPQAGLAIESIRALEPVLRECGVDEALVRDLEQARTNLQLAYAKAVAESPAAAGPAAASTKPPIAGPMARAMLKPMPFSAMAPTRSPRGTSSGVAAAQAGKFTAVPAPMAKVSASRPQGPSASAAARTASSTPMAAIQSWAATSARRRSRMSAAAPPGRAKRKTGSMAAACTRPTISGEGASEVISQPAPVFWIHMPVLEARLAIQSARKAGWRRGAKAPGADMLGDDMVRALLHGWMAPVPHR
jgi:hypothetical protein